VRIGGNSSCVEVNTGDHTLVFDAGTGIIGLGRDLLRRPGKPEVHIFLSHLHHDHIEGLRHFAPAHCEDWHCHLYGPGSAAGSLERTLQQTMDTRVFPVAFAELAADVSMRTLGKQETVRLAGSKAVAVEARFSKAHPKVGVLLYRIEYAGHSIVYATDVEAPKGGHADVVDLARGADLLICDSQYTDAEYFEDERNKAGWGHSTVRMAAEIARDAAVGQLLLYHHDPTHNDKQVRSLERLARGVFRNSQAAYEGLELKLSA
jgi:ribonuclease BN (tRNA processing enzyme)